MKATPIITFKAKVTKLEEADGSISEIIDYKRQVTRRDCNLKPHEHTYYNSDLFPAMLQRAYSEAIAGRQFVRLSALPESVKVDATGFLASVTVTLPQSFMR